ncbi:BtpA/SgcQ family protein [uncultured Olegusella sp.]|uniref:BtpA/SgcQ family protein n=1 Tax=uncultured Olegusella sp. TaxID=1979846 RepID=UPI00261AEDCD|nr:BtpA/SgcQ family protein [uncultured Olegusella sp.]
MTLFNKIFSNKKPIIGMVHLAALPSSPTYGGSMADVYAAALSDLRALIAGGIDAVIVENFGDVPYATKSNLINYLAISNIFTRLRESCNLPMGINVQFNDCRAEWDIAYTCDADFVRVEVFAENRMGPNGVCIASGPDLMRLKAAYPAEIALLADLQVKHTFPITEQPVDFTVESIIEGGADAVICTGLVTGKSPSLDEVQQVKKCAGDFPVLVGSGVNASTASTYLDVADGVIVGSSIKEGGKVTNPVNEHLVQVLMESVEGRGVRSVNR